MTGSEHPGGSPTTADEAPPAGPGGVEGGGAPDRVGEPRARKGGDLRPSHLVVGAWVAANGVLAGIMLGFRPQPISMLLWLFDLLLVSGFGVAVLLALRAERGIGTTVRMPVRSTAAVLTALGLTLAGLALAYGRLWLLVALYPLVAAAVIVRGERVPPGTRPAPAALDGMPPAEPSPGRRPFVHRGGSTGPAVPVPADHPGHEAASARPTDEHGRTGRLAVLLVAVPTAARAAVRALRGGRRG